MSQAHETTSPQIRRRPSSQEKQDITRFARNESVSAACTKFGVARSSIHAWMRNEAKSPGRALFIQDRGDDSHEGETLDSHTSSGSLPQNTITRNRDDRASEHDATPTTPDVGFILVGYQGAPSGFIEIAARRAFGKLHELDALPAKRFEVTGYPHMKDVLEALYGREIDYAFLPTDSIFSNTNNTVLDQFVDLQLEMVAEVSFKERAVVCSLEGTTLDGADCFVSDWSVLQRYEAHILEMESRYATKLQRQVVWDSATGCEIVSEERAENTLVICSEEAAAAHGLTVQGSRIIPTTSPKYTIIGRHGSGPITVRDTTNRPRSHETTRSSAIIVHAHDTALLDVVSAFTYRRLHIEHICTREQYNTSARKSYLIAYRTSVDERIERGLQLHLSAATHRVTRLGNYFTYALS